MAPRGRGKIIFAITEQDVWDIAEEKGIHIPKEKREAVLETVKAYIEGYLWDTAYSIWEVIEDGIRDALKEA